MHMPPKCQPRAMACFSLPLLLIVSCFSSTTLQYAGVAAAAQYRHHPMQMMQVQGFVFCDACRESRLSNFSLPIPGATILLTCKSTRRHPSTSTPFTTTASSDKYGAFFFDIPLPNPRLLMRKCTVRLTNSPFEACTTQTRFSRRALPPILRAKSNRNAQLTYSSGWLTYQPKSLPSFCNAIPRQGFTQNDHNVGHSKDTKLLPQDFSFPNFLPPFPTLPPLPTIPGLTPPTSPFNAPPVPGFPPLPQFPPFPNFPSSPPNPLSSFPPFPPPLGIPPNPLSPTTPTPSSNAPPLQFPPLSPPGLPISPFAPNPLFSNTPPNSPSPFLPPFQFPTLPPSPQFPPFSPIPLSPPSNLAIP